MPGKGGADGVALLAQARALGLRVAARAGILEVRGPITLEWLARRLLRAKPAEMAALCDEAYTPPTRPCSHCGRGAFWKRAGGAWVCATCHPAASSDVVSGKIEIIGRDRFDAAALELLERFGWVPVGLSDDAGCSRPGGAKDGRVAGAH